MPFYQGGSSIPKGIIAIWSGSIASIPSGWKLCDGNNGTPDLRNRFIIGAQKDDLGFPVTMIFGTEDTIGGAVDQNATFSASSGQPSSTSTGGVGINVASSTHTHQVDGTTDSFEIIPPFYALAYIMKL
jgi:hypothetical protein